MKTLGIVTINYNSAEGLERTIKSVLSQEFKDFYWIIVDGDSKDLSKEILKKYMSQINSIVIEKDEGIYDALNKGIELCNAEYIVALNSGDTFYDKQVLLDVNKAILYDQKKNDIYFGKANYILEKSNILNWNWPCINNNLKLDWLDYYNPNHQCAFISKKIYTQIKYNKYFKSCGDTDFWIRIKKNKFKFKFLNRIISNFYLGGTSNSYNNLKEVIKITNEASIMNYFYNRENIFNSYLKNILKNVFKMLLKKLLGKETYYKKLKSSQYKKQKKYDIKEK